MIPQELVNQLFNTNNQSCSNSTRDHENETKREPTYIIHIFKNSCTKNKVFLNILSEYINQGYFKFNQYNQLINNARNSIKPIVPSFEAHRGEGTDIKNKIIQHN